ncbi:MAG: hypothetical protein ACOVNU_11230, partial [Candidatus Kapaibacteriota bacterium]
IAIIAILLISFFGMNLEEGKGQCLPGFVPVNVTIMVNGCQVNADICVKCAPHALVAAEIHIKQWGKVIDTCTFSPTLTISEELNAVKNAIIQQRLKDICSISPCCPKEPQDPPCYDLKVEFYLPLCIQKTWSNGKIIRQTCSTKDGHCKSIKYVCLDNEGNLVTGTETYEESGNANCQLNSEPVDPTKNNPVTQCFKIQTPCGTP